MRFAKRGAKMKIINRGVASIALAFGLFTALLTGVSPQAVAQKEDHTPAALSPQELFKRLSPSVFVVEVLDENGSLVATGSAVAVAPDQVVTNKHVIEAGVAFRIKQGSKTWPAAVAYVDPDHDLGRLAAEGLKAPAVPVRFSPVLTVGEHVYSIGAPEGLELTISEGLISGLREFEQVRLIQTSAAISHGSSGGGLFDAQGQLVGITTFFLKDGQNLNFALPGEWVRAVASHRVSSAEKNKIATPASQALSWFQLGVQMIEAADYKKAVRAFREVVRLKPGESAAWSNLGAAYNDLQQYDNALPACQEAIRLKADLVEAWSNLGDAYDGLQQVDKAISAYHEAIRLKPDYANAWYNLGVTYAGLQQADKAISAFLEAIRLDPLNAKAWYNLGVSYAGLQQVDKAISAYQEAIRIKPDYANAWDNLGTVYDDLHQYEKAISAIQEAIRLKPDDANDWNNLGTSYAHLHQADKAIPAFQEAIRLKPDYAIAWYNLGIGFRVQGDRSSVMTVYEKLKTLDQNRADKFFREIVLP
jgi:tetratricopeptide (TPR) repeat protein